MTNDDNFGSLLDAMEALYDAVDGLNGGKRSIEYVPHSIQAKGFDQTVTPPVAGAAGSECCPAR